MSEQFSYHADIVLVIDGTNSMTPVLTEVKAAASSFHRLMSETLSREGKTVTEMRLRIVVFRDLFDNGARSLEASEFYSLPQDEAAFSAWVGKITLEGNTTNTESGLAGLAVAINSNWTSSGDRRRHVVVLWTDDDAHLPEAELGRAPTAFSDLVASSFDELSDLWSSSQRISSQAQRLVLFAPDRGVWTTIAENWDNTIFFPSQAGQGMADFELDQILAGIANSI